MQDAAEGIRQGLKDRVGTHSGAGSGNKMDLASEPEQQQGGAWRGRRPPRPSPTAWQACHTWPLIQSIE